MDMDVIAFFCSNMFQKQYTCITPANLTYLTFDIFRLLVKWQVTFVTVSWVILYKLCSIDVHRFKYGLNYGSSNKNSCNASEEILKAFPSFRTKQVPGLFLTMTSAPHVHIIYCIKLYNSIPWRKRIKTAISMEILKL